MSGTRSWRAPFQSALRVVTFIVCHMLVAVVLIAATRVITIALAKEGDPKLFDEIPIRYFFDAMDVLILLGLIVATGLTMWKLARE